MPYVRHSVDTVTDPTRLRATAPGTAAWPSANLAIYVPVSIPLRATVLKMWVGCSTTGTGNVDVGLYDAAGTALISGTGAAHPAADTEMVFDVTDTVVGPGLFYIAVSSDSATDTFYRINPTAPICAAQGILTEASAYPLPATATWAVNQTLAYWPVAGVLLEGTMA